MNEIRNWNNGRHSGSYWVSIFLLTGVSMNISVWFSMDEIPIINIFRNLFYNFYSQVVLDIANVGSGYLMLTLLTLYVVTVLLIGIWNYMCSHIPQIKDFKVAGTFSYLLNSVVISDVILGIIMEGFAIRGLIVLRDTLRITSIGTWIYILMFLAGSYLYWEDIIILPSIFHLKEIMSKRDVYEDTVWYCVSNCHGRISTFSKVPWKGKAKVFMVDKVDLVRYENIAKANFCYYLIVIDGRYQLDNDVREDIMDIVLLPHAKVLTLFLGMDNQHKDLESFLRGQRNVTVSKLPQIRCIGSIYIEEIMESFMFEHEILKKSPMGFTENEIIKSTYLGMRQGTKLCRDFMKIIINDIDILPSIYALFDFIDLQYRFAIGLLQNSDFKGQISWMKKKKKIIGNIGIMKKIVTEKIIQGNYERIGMHLTVDILFHEILTESEICLIRKYLPNYKKDYAKPFEDTVVYLTTSLRNILRGHGTFYKEDSPALYSLIFKLAMLNCYILDANEIHLEQDRNIIWKNSENNYYFVVGKYKENVEKHIGPFWVSTQNGDILIFNNWIDDEEGEKIEYINYLDGRVKLIKYEDTANLTIRKTEEKK